MKFSIVADYFQKIENESSRTGMTKLLAELFSHARSKEIEIITNLALGQLHPPYKALQFNMADKNVIKAIAHVLDMSEETVSRHAKTKGDLGLVVNEGNWHPKQELTVSEVFEQLNGLQQISGTGSQDEKIQALAQLLHSVSPVAAKYIVRIIVGKLRLGFSDMTVIDALSWMETGDKSLSSTIENAYNVCVDLGKVASVLKEGGVKAVESMDIMVGIPIRPAAAERMPTAQAIFHKLGSCVAQPKLDGFRLQIHVDKTHKKPKIHFFSRNLIDMSYMFPDITTLLEDLDVETIICEGEAIVYDPNTQTFLPFQETVKRKRKHGIDEAIQEFPLRVFIFDLLYLDGKSVMDKTHEQRRHLLAKVFKSFKHDDIQVIEEKEISSGKELEHYFEQNISAGLEGLVVKRPDAHYQPGKRNFNWIKLKRQEEGHLEDTLDCVVLGYYAGEGKRASFGIGAFLVGLYNPKEDRFETVAKIGTGLSDEQWKELKKKCDAVKLSHAPKNAFVAKELEPDVWTEPEIVCSIRADEITISPLHTAGKTTSTSGYALRFPRFMGYRPDKSPTEATTIHEIKRLYEDQY